MHTDLFLRGSADRLAVANRLTPFEDVRDDAATELVELVRPPGGRAIDFQAGKPKGDHPGAEDAITLAFAVEAHVNPQLRGGVPGGHHLGQATERRGFVDDSAAAPVDAGRVGYFG